MARQLAKRRPNREIRHSDFTKTGSIHAPFLYLARISPFGVAPPISPPPNLPSNTLGCQNLTGIASNSGVQSHLNASSQFPPQGPRNPIE